MIEKELCLQAIKAMDNAYAPYSSYRVGAALLCQSGRVYTGCNIENSSYTPTVCAERVAFFKAISEGEQKFSMIAIAGGKDGEINGLCSPCGVCRQVMSEFCSPDFLILTVSDKENYQKHKLSELLPMAFTQPK